MQRKIATLGLLCACAVNVSFAEEGAVPAGIPHLDHVYLIMMENHGFSQIIDNPSAPFINYYARTANLATNYFAIAHPSLNNYLEIVGGSNFGVQSDNDPDWHNFYCESNLESKTVNSDNPPSPDICPISGVGSDAPVPAIDMINETQGAPGTVNIDGTKSYSAKTDVVGKSIADQLVDAGLSWKSYQESLPPAGQVDFVTYSDGFFTNNTDFTAITPTLTPPLDSSGIVHLYAAKHNPFVYFQSVQEGFSRNSSLANTVDFTGFNGLYADLATGNVPNFLFIVPNQCNDQHGRGNADQGCNYDPDDNGTQEGLNPALTLRADATVRQLVASIKTSPSWASGNNAIVIVWDENDYSLAPYPNAVVLIVDTSFAGTGYESSQYYTHFALLKTLEAGFGLPCLNHACDSDQKVMADLFPPAGTPTAGAVMARTENASSKATPTSATLMTH
jgi:phosphatidylinositol-3-phosphatase